MYICNVIEKFKSPARITVEVFRTNVHDPEVSDHLVAELFNRFPHYRINFDLQDCDRILRVAGKHMEPDLIIDFMHARGFRCEILED